MVGGNKKSVLMSRSVIVSVGLVIATVIACAAFISVSARRSFVRSVQEELVQTQHNMSLSFAVSLNEQKILVLQMAKSNTIAAYLESPDDNTLSKLAVNEFESYRSSFLSNSVFWTSDKDRVFYTDAEPLYVVDPEDPDSYWYKMTLEGKTAYNFNINFNEALNKTNLWVNAVVKNAAGHAVGMVGSGIPLTNFVDTMYSKLPRDCKMFLYNDELETTGSLDIKHLEQKKPIMDLIPDFSGREDMLRSADSQMMLIGNVMYSLASLGEIGWHIVLFKEYDFTEFRKGAGLPFMISTLIIILLAVGIFLFFRLRSFRDNERETARKLLSETQNLAVAAKENAATSQDQSAAVKEIVATMADNNALSESIATKIKDVSSVAGKTNDDVSEGVQHLELNVAQLREIAEANQNTISGIKNLSEKINNIWDIVTLINSVADQAKIIAFNAELEASSAGEAGMNFHIVATEIRRLADGIIDGTKEIKEKINEIQQSSDSLILASESGTVKIEKGCDTAKALEERFESIKNASEVTATSAGDITTIIQQQAAATEQMLSTLKQIAGGVESFSGATEAISVASQKLKEIAEDLNK